MASEPTTAPTLPAVEGPTDDLSSIADMIRNIHYYGWPPDSRLQDDVDRDVDGILDEVRAKLSALRTTVSTLTEARDALVAGANVVAETLSKVRARRDKASDQVDILMTLAAKYACAHEDARSCRFSVDGTHWASTPIKAVRAYLEFVTSADATPPSPRSES